MKNLYLLVILLGFTAVGYSQEAKHFGARAPGCGFDHLINGALQNNNAIDRMETFDKSVQAYKRNWGNIQKNGPNGANIIIPVAVWVIYGNGTPSTYISDNQIVTQITALNDYYEPYGITFCLATKDNSGNTLTGTLPGVFRNNSATLTELDVQTELATLNSAFTPLLPTTKYLNIYIVKEINDSGVSATIMGMGMIPSLSDDFGFDGIVMRYDAFGNIDDPLCTSCTLASNSNHGKYLVHEAGHYLGLFHTFMEGCLELDGGDCELNGDRVCDTPPVAQPNSGCTLINSCNESPDLPDDINNYMDYSSESCLNSFTDGQLENMLATINLYRFQLTTPENLAHAGITCIPATLISEFTAPTYAPCSGSSLQFTGVAVTGATYAWDFGDGTTGPPNLVVTHSFANSPTPYTVTFTVTAGGQSISSSKLIYVTNCTGINTVETNWLFSIRNAMSFQTGVPIQSTITYGSTLLQFQEACAVRSDATGQLQLFTNGIRVWNGQQQLINASNLLLGNTSSRNGVIIVPDPANSNDFYIFTKDAKMVGSNTAGPNGFRYTKATVSGLTATLSSFNTPVTTPSGFLTGNNGAILGSEGITAIENCDGHWILTCLQKSTGLYVVVYQLSATGLTYTSQFLISQLSGNIPLQSSLKASPDGNRLVLCGYNDEYYLYNFNKHTGVVSGALNLDANGAGACFSPNSQLLYVGAGGNFYQYDLNAADIVASRQMLANNLLVSDLQLGPDHKIYIARASTNIMPVIHYPNNIVTADNPNACHLSEDGPEVQTNLSTSLPNLIDAKIDPAFNNTISTITTSCLGRKFNANVCGDTFSWNFGDPSSGLLNTSISSSPTHTFTAAGTYTISVNVSGTVVATQVTVGGSVPVITGATTACTTTGGLTGHSTAISSGQTLQWSVTSGSGTFGGPNYFPDVVVHWTSLPGTLTLTVTDAAGCANVTEQEVTEYCPGDVCAPNIVFGLPQAATTASYSVSNSIVTDNNYQVPATANVSLLATNLIHIKTNSWVKNGAYFLARLEDCVAPPPALDTPDDQVQALVGYPNPTDGLFHLSGIPINEVYMYDVLGKDVLYQKFDGVTEVTLNIATLQQGIYFLKVISLNGTSEILKVIKE
jgi:hypothetical protein